MMLKIKRIFGLHQAPADPFIWIKPNLIAGIEPVSRNDAVSRQGHVWDCDRADADEPACIISMAHCYLPDIHAEQSAEEVVRMRDEALGIKR